MSQTDGICIYVFSGPHVGAEIVLLDGTYSIGTDDSCDIIFKDTFLAPKHAQLDIISDKEHGFSLKVIPLEGDIWVNNEQVPKVGYEPKAGEFWYLGGSCLAWNIPGTNWNNKAAQLYAERLSLEEQAKNITDELGSIEQNDNLEDGHEGSFVDKALKNVLPQEVVANLARFPVGKIFGVMLLIFFLGAILISFTSEEQAGAEQVRILQELLKENGFDNVSVIQGIQQVIVRGFVKNDTQRQFVYSLAQGIHVPVYIDVGVRDDIINAIKMAFASRGIYVSVKEFDDPGIFSISGYMKDGFVEEWAISAMRDDVLFPFKLEKHVVYAKEVSEVLQKAFQKNKLEQLRVTYLAGDIEISGIFDEERKKNLDQALEEIKKDLGVPIVFKVKQVKPAPLVANSKSQEESVESDIDNSLNTLLGGSVVAGVTMQPIPFITLNTGERIFKGGALPSGFVLDTVSLEHLVFYKDSRYIEYPLRGAK